MLNVYSVTTYLDKERRQIDEEYIKKITEDNKVICKMENRNIDFSAIKARVGEKINYYDNNDKKIGILKKVELPEETKDKIGKIYVCLI